MILKSDVSKAENKVLEICKKCRQHFLEFCKKCRQDSQNVFAGNVIVATTMESF